MSNVRDCLENNKGLHTQKALLLELMAQDNSYPFHFRTLLSDLDAEVPAVL